MSINEPSTAESKSITRERREQIENVLSTRRTFSTHIEVDLAAIARELHRALRAAESERDKLAKFKEYVHSRLDDAGVPTDPESPHKAEGCRIGGRLDIVLDERRKLAAACQMALDSYTMIADEYENKYYPMAGPTCLTDTLRAALAAGNKQP